MRTADFDYRLPPELIAQKPAAVRDQSRLLVLERATGRIHHRHFPDLLAYLRPGDALILNNSRVIRARLRGVKPASGGQVEILLLEENVPGDWWVMLRPGKRVRPGTQIHFQKPDGQPSTLRAVVVEKNAEGHCRLEFSGVPDLLKSLETLGEIPLPPYIRRPPGGDFGEDQERYQTVYAQPPGSAAAPTAGLHFTPEILAQIRALRVRIGFVTLHVGQGTFAPVKTEALADHQMHEERFELSHETAELIAETKRNGGRVFAVGTTTTRVLESVAAQNGGGLKAQAGKTRAFIYPPCDFKVVDALLTNFHLPQSTLLMLVSAFAAPGETRGRGLVLAAYAAAVQERYRFFSYGDAMLIV